jgi:hypothetical protein
VPASRRSARASWTAFRRDHRGEVYDFSAIACRIESAIVFIRPRQDLGFERSSCLAPETRYRPHHRQRVPVHSGDRRGPPTTEVSKRAAVPFLFRWVCNSDEACRRRRICRRSAFPRSIRVFSQTKPQSSQTPSGGISRDGPQSTGDLLHSSGFESVILFENARRTCNRDRCLLGGLSIGARASSLRATAYRTNAGRERALTGAGPDALPVPVERLRRGVRTRAC